MSEQRESDQAARTHGQDLPRRANANGEVPRDACVTVEDPVLTQLLRLAPRYAPGEEGAARVAYDVHMQTRPGDLEPDEHGGVQVAAVVCELPEAEVTRRIESGRSAVKRHKLEVYRTDATGTAYVMRESHLVVGHPRGSRKVYASWRTVSWRRVRVLPDGRWLRTRRYSRGAGYTSEHLYRDDTEPLLRLLLPAPVDVAHYAPLAQCLFELDTDAAGTPTRVYGPLFVLSAFAGAADIPTLTRQLFGKRAYRKDLARSLGQLLTRDDAACRRAALSQVLLAWAVRGLVPVDWQVALLRGQGITAHPGQWPSAEHIVGLRRHLRQLDQRSLRRLVLHTGNVHWAYLRDIAIAPPVPGLTRVDSWTDLHDIVLPPGLPGREVTSGAWARAAATDFAVTKPTRLHRELPGVTAGGRTVLVASTGTQLREWGTAMRHCIATYQLRLWRKTSLLGAVLDIDGSMLGNFEVELTGDGSGRLVQLLGHRNTTLPETVRVDVEAHLAGRGVLADTYLGGPPRTVGHDLAA
ncbi:hypothetical protein [Pseudactinotalea terrae]|uniref:hypothetical protein n=1 Tax=Pseudactinotalea terrae TaxID=1743262 RepID=UPI0012E24665|nr:hypothetical protein [Pseudactinotalea terrae]